MTPSRRQWLQPMLAGLLVFGVYAMTAPRTVVYEDDGLFILAAWFNGIAHPPGYPLWTLLAGLWSRIPIGEVAWRVHLFSALCGGLAIAALWVLIRDLGGQRGLAWLAALLFGWSGVWWSQAIVAEVYTLNILLILLVLIVACRYRNSEGPQCLHLLRGLGLLVGLGLSHHWPLFLLAMPMLVPILSPCLSRLWQQSRHAWLPLIAGLTPYLWLVWRSRMDPAIGFYGPIETLHDFWYVISRAGYAAVDRSMTAGWTDRIGVLGNSLASIVHAAGPVAAVLAVPGWYATWKCLPRWFNLALLTGFVCSTVVLVGLLGFDDDPLHRAIFRVYPLLASLVWSVWAAAGGWYLIYKSTNRLRHTGRTHLWGAITIVTLIVATLLTNLAGNLRASDTVVRDYAAALLDTLAPEAILFVDGDIVTGAVGYLHLVEGYRPDITLYHSHGLVYGNRLFRGDGRQTEPERWQDLFNFIGKAEHPVYFDGYADIGVAVEFNGLHSRVIKNGHPRMVSFSYDPRAAAYLDAVTAMSPTDPWARLHWRDSEQHYCFLLSGLTAFSIDPVKQEIFTRRRGEVCGGFYGELGWLRQLMLAQSIDVSQASGVADTARQHIGQALRIRDRAEFLLFEALVLRAAGDEATARERLRESVEIWAQPDNPAHRLLADPMHM